MRVGIGTPLSKGGAVGNCIGRPDGVELRVGGRRLEVCKMILHSCTTQIRGHAHKIVEKSSRAGGVRFLKRRVICVGDMKI